jgi:hypothetical protein
MRGASIDQTHITAARRGTRRDAPERAQRMSRLEAPPVSFVTRTMPEDSPYGHHGVDHLNAAAALPAAQREPGMGSATALPALPVRPFAQPSATPTTDPDVWLIALPTASGGVQSLEGTGRAGAIRVSRPYGHLRAIRPVALDPVLSGPTEPVGNTRSVRRSGDTTAPLGHASASSSARLPAPRPAPSVVSAVEVETDAGLFRVERRGSVLGHSDLAWALANLEAGEPESVVPLPRRQLALLLTLLPSPQDPEHPEQDPIWGWAHRLRGPWERGPLHTRGRLGRLIAFDPDESARGMHRACFELLGTEEIVWAVGVPCFRTGSVYELVPLGKGLNPSRWLSWPLSKGRKKAGAQPAPTWEIARVVYRVGAPRWPLAGVVEPLGPMGVAG